MLTALTSPDATSTTLTNPRRTFALIFDGGGERDRRSVRRPGEAADPPCAGSRHEQRQRRAVGIDEVEPRLTNPGVVVAGEGDPRAIGRPGDRAPGRQVIDDRMPVATVGVDELDGASAVVLRERKSRPVGRPDRIGIVRRGVGDLVGRPRRRVHDQDLVHGGHREEPGERRGGHQARPDDCEARDRHAEQDDQQGEAQDGELEAAGATRPPPGHPLLRRVPAPRCAPGRTRARPPPRTTGWRAGRRPRSPRVRLPLTHGPAPCAAARGRGRCGRGSRMPTSPGPQRSRTSRGR